MGVVATDGSFLHLALIQPNMKWLKLPFSPLVTAKAVNVPKPRGNVINFIISLSKRAVIGQFSGPYSPVRTR